MRVQFWLKQLSGEYMAVVWGGHPGPILPLTCCRQHSARTYTRWFYAVQEQYRGAPVYEEREG